MILGDDVVLLTSSSNNSDPRVVVVIIIVYSFSVPKRKMCVPEIEIIREDHNNLSHSIRRVNRG